MRKVRPRDIYHMNIGKCRDGGGERGRERGEGGKREGGGGGGLLTKVMSLRWRSTGVSQVKAIRELNQLSNCPHFDR